MCPFTATSVAPVPSPPAAPRAQESVPAPASALVQAGGGVDGPLSKKRGLADTHRTATRKSNRAKKPSAKLQGSEEDSEKSDVDDGRGLSRCVVLPVENVRKRIAFQVLCFFVHVCR